MINGVAKADRTVERKVGDLFAGLAVELAAFPGMIAQIQREHVRDGQGYCAARDCGRPGYGSGCIVHPCPTRVLADLAESARRRRGRR